MKITKHIPNIFTLINSLCGGAAIYCISFANGFRGEASPFIEVTCGLLLVAMLVDFLDGFLARALKASSELGKQLDSLSDVVSFGVGPALLAQYLFLEARHYAGGEFLPDFGKVVNIALIPLYFIPLVIIPFSAYRLGKFNLDTRQTSSFLGLPTPANAFFWVGLALSHETFKEIAPSGIAGRCNQLLDNPWAIILLSLAFSILLVVEIPMFALKFKGFGWKGNEIKFIFLGLSLVAIILLKVFALPLIIILYIVLSIVANILKLNTHELRS